jgi:sulfur carrier protein ThiS
MPRLKIHLERENKTTSLELTKTITVKYLLEKLNINPVTVLVSKNNEVCTEQEIISSKDNIKIISVVSGG